MAIECILMTTMSLHIAKLEDLKAQPWLSTIESNIHIYIYIRIHSHIQYMFIYIYTYNHLFINNEFLPFRWWGFSTQAYNNKTFDQPTWPTLAQLLEAPMSSKRPKWFGPTFTANYKPEDPTGREGCRLKGERFGWDSWWLVVHLSKVRKCWWLMMVEYFDFLILVSRWFSSRWDITQIM